MNISISKVETNVLIRDMKPGTIFKLTNNPQFGSITFLKIDNTSLDSNITCVRLSTRGYNGTHPQFSQGQWGSTVCSGNKEDKGIVVGFLEFSEEN